MFECAAARPDPIRLGSILSSENPEDIRQTIGASSLVGNRELDRLRQRVDKVALTPSTGSANLWLPMGRPKPDFCNHSVVSGYCGPWMQRAPCVTQAILGA